MRTEDMCAFAAVAKALNIGVAAKRLGIAQTTLADRLKGFEREFSAPLLVRAPRPPWLTLTEEGERVLSDVLAVLELEERMLGGGALRQRRGPVRIGANESVAHTWLFHWLARFHREQPGVDVDLRVETTEALDDRCRNGGLDLAVGARALGGQDVHKQQLPSLSLAFVGSAKRVASTAGTTSLKAIAAAGLITFQPASQPYRSLMALLTRERIPCDAVHTASSISAMVELVEHGFGVATLPDMLAVRASARQLRVFPCELGLPSLPVWLSWPQPTSSASQRTVDSLRAYARDELV